MLDFPFTFAELKTAFLFSIGASAVAYFALNRLEAVISDDFREKIAKTILPNHKRNPVSPLGEALGTAKKSPANEDLPNWADQFSVLMDSFFGKDHFSWGCIWRSSLISFTSAFVLIYFVMDEFVYGHLIENTKMPPRLSGVTVEIITKVIFYLFPIVINLVPDYFSLLESRWIISKFSKNQSSFKTLFLLFSDLFLTAIIFLFWVTIFSAPSIYERSLAEASTLSEKINAKPDVKFGLFAFFSIFFIHLHNLCLALDLHLCILFSKSNHVLSGRP